jgi:hypothetical protein
MQEKNIYSVEHPPLPAVDNDQIHRMIDDKDSFLHVDPLKVPIFIESAKNLPEYRKYLGLKVTSQTLDSILGHFDSKTIDRKEDVEVVKAKALLNKMIYDIRNLVSEYYQKVRAMELVRIQQFRLEREEYLSRLENSDRSRKITHDALMSAVSSLTRYCYRTLPEQIHIDNPITSWFTGDELRDRIYIREWAYTFEMGRRIEDFIQYIENEKNKKEVA